MNHEDTKTTKENDLKPPLPGHITLPEGVSYDGVITAERLGITLLQFTDRASGPSHGASFSVEAQYLTQATLHRKLREVRQSFRIPATVTARPSLCPPAQRRPVALEIPRICK